MSGCTKALAQVVALSALGDHTVALRHDGTMVAWGANGDGQTNVPGGEEGRVGTEEVLQQSLRALRRQGIQPQLGIVCLAAPAILVLRPVADQEEQTPRRKRLAQLVQERLCL